MKTHFINWAKRVLCERDVIETIGALAVMVSLLFVAYILVWAMYLTP